MHLGTFNLDNVDHKTVQIFLWIDKIFYHDKCVTFLSSPPRTWAPTFGHHFLEKYFIILHHHFIFTRAILKWLSPELPRTIPRASFDLVPSYLPSHAFTIIKHHHNQSHLFYLWLLLNYHIYSVPSWSQNYLKAWAITHMVNLHDLMIFYTYSP